MHTQPIEDIEAVLGRFQAWAGTQGATKANRGIRELSYDEALCSSRYRWPGNSRTSAKKKQEPETPAVKLETRASTQPRRKPQPKPKSAAKDRLKPAFREVLEEAVKPAAAVATTAPAEPAELGRQVAISIRLAPAERAIIKTRAAEAGITASAYIRQCALEVEQLRAQVREAVARMERGRTAPSASLRPGFLSRCLRRLFHRRSPSLALRV